MSRCQDVPLHQTNGQPGALMDYSIVTNAVNGFLDAYAYHDDELVHKYYDQMCLLFGRYCAPYREACPCGPCRAKRETVS